MLKIETSVAKIGFDTAENEPAKNFQNSGKMLILRGHGGRVPGPHPQREARRRQRLGVPPPLRAEDLLRGRDDTRLLPRRRQGC